MSALRTYRARSSSSARFCWSRNFAPNGDFLATAFFAAAFFAGAFLATTFSTGAFLAAAFFATTFSTGAF
ncbi:MAG TPA: membrane protein insertion efficiency factor YidD, partial [Acidimicrobiia bacterium]|nr:membrane protein insertion efficiency factor YidD [Acidimicrobiia bacterium]